MVRHSSQRSFLSQPITQISYLLIIIVVIAVVVIMRVICMHAYMCVHLHGKLRGLPQCHSLDTVHHCPSMAWNLLKDPLVSASLALESQVHATYHPWPCYMDSGLANAGPYTGTLSP